MKKEIAETIAAIRAAFDSDNAPRKNVAVIKASDRITELEAALRSVLNTETDRYACASERNLIFAQARKTLNEG